MWSTCTNEVNDHVYSCMCIYLLIAEGMLWRSVCVYSLSGIIPFACTVVYTALEESSLEKIVTSEDGRFDLAHDTMSVLKWCCKCI